MKPPDVIADHIPASLRALPQWVGWRYVERDGKQTKCPVNPMTGAPADSTDPKTWTTFDEALRAYRSDSLAGIGFVFTREGGLCGVDLDNALDPETRTLKPWGREIVERLVSYTEISPSGHGVKVFLKATKPGSRCRKAHEDGEVEVYDFGRFFTVTGIRLDDTSAEVEDRQAELDDVYARIFGKNGEPAEPSTPPTQSPAPRLTDDDVLRLASRSRKSGEKFQALWSGQWNGFFNSPSEADASVVFTLAFYTKDAVQIDRLFRQSRLFRPKWDEYHGQQTYGELTIAKALENVTGQYRPSRRCRKRPPSATGESASQNGGALIPLGSRDPATGRLVLSSRRTLPTATAFVDEFHQHDDGRTLLSYAGLMMGWQDNRYVQVEDEALKHRLQPWLHEALQYVYNKRTGDYDLVPFDSNPGTVRAALDSIRTYTHLPASVTPPTWLSEAPDRPPANEIVPCKTINLHIPTADVLPATPALFTTCALEFDFDADAPVPERWLTFLRELWDDDTESIALLQEWFGYCLTADTSQQKMLLLVGPRRCGKGTIGRILTRLIGAGNVVGPTISSLAGLFGLQPLIGKSLAIVSDARFKGADLPAVVERLLCISGEDALTIDRKYLEAVTMKLPTRFMFLTNELPRFTDVSGALAGRFMVLRFTESFFGREDLKLLDKLVPELPSILLWALQGWVRLHERGRFVQPAASEGAIRDFEDLTSPVGAFVRERCVVGTGHTVEAGEFFQAWKDYCQSIGRDHHGTAQTFGRDLRAAVPGLKVRQPRMGSGRLRWYDGIALAHSADDGMIP